MNNLEFRVPKDEKEFNEYDLFRWRLLRKPIGKTIESLKDEYEDNSFHLIGVIDNQIVACGRLHFIDDSKAQIRYMAVDSRFKRRGIGSEIVDKLERYATSNGAVIMV